MEYLFRNMRGIGLLRLCNFLLFLGLWPLVRIQGKKKKQKIQKRIIYICFKLLLFGDLLDLAITIPIWNEDAQTIHS
jgi:hypothetical protein